MLASGPSDASKISMRPARAAASTTNGSSEKAGAAANNKVGNVKNARIAPYLTGFSGSGIFGLTGSCGAGGFTTMMPVYTGTGTSTSTGTSSGGVLTTTTGGAAGGPFI